MTTTYTQKVQHRSRQFVTTGLLRDVGAYLLQQIQDRFDTQGRSGGTPWPGKAIHAWGYDDGRKALSGRTGQLRRSFHVRLLESEKAVEVFSDCPYAALHQLGTVGKGGVLPTIKPVRAKALFIPITDAAQKAEGFSGAKAAYIRRDTDQWKPTGAIRAVVTLRGRRPPVIQSLRKGRLSEGRLEVWDEDAGEYQPGIPDFIFLAKVDIPPRPMLPDSRNEQSAQAGFILSRIGGKRG